MTTSEDRLDPVALAGLYSANSDAIYQLDLDGRFVHGNESLCAITGYDIDELQALTFREVIHPDDLPRIEAEFERALAGDRRRYQTRGIRKDGSEFTADVTKFPVSSDDGAVVALLGVARDLEPVRDAIRRTDEITSMLRIASRVARLAGWSYDLAERRLILSQELYEMLGIPPSDERAEDLAARVTPQEHLAAQRDAFRCCVEDGTPIDLTGPVRTATGDTLIVQTLGEAVRDDEGRVARVHGAFFNITDQFREREQTRLLERRLQTTLDQISDGVCFLDRDWRFTFVNRAGERIMRNPREVALGASIWELYPELRSTEFGIAYRRTMDERVVSTARDYYAHLDTWFEITSYPTDEGIMIYFKDVSESERTRREIGLQTRRIRDQATLLEASRDAMIVRGLDHTIHFWNRAASEQYGWSAEEALGRSARELIYDDPAEFDQATAIVAREGYWSGELRQRRRDGSVLIAECRWQLVRDDDGTAASIFAVNTDVTETRREQEQRIRAQRMESLGTLAGGIAHDLNNVLTPILMSVQLLRDGEDDDARRELLDTMDAGVKRGADMIRQVLSFARGIEGERALIEIGELLGEVIGFCRDTLPKSVTATAAIEGRPWTVVGDRTQLMQVLVNLVTNARDAMPEGGAISIRARNVELDERYRAVTHVAPPGRYVAIDVEDDGHGMSAETLSKIFEPFFTTKPQGFGTGLGLPTSMAIVRSHGGYIQAYSEPDNGTRFQLHLPAAVVGGAEPSPEEPVAAIARGRGERVLVVDDEAAIRQVVRQTLAENGYEAVVAANGREAIEIVEEGRDAIDLVLTDMMMPVMDGTATALYLMEHHPGIVVVAASGLNAHGGVAHVDTAGVSHFLAKPFTTEALLTTLREALDGR